MSNINFEFNNNSNNYEFGFIKDTLNWKEVDGFKTNDYSSDYYCNNFRSNSFNINEDYTSFDCLGNSNSNINNFESMEVGEYNFCFEMDSQVASQDTHSLQGCENEKAFSTKNSESSKAPTKKSLSQTDLMCSSISGDLNLFVERLLNSNPVESLKEQGIEVDEKTAKLLSIKKRKRKTKSQIDLLEQEYSANPDWSKSFMKKYCRKQVRKS